MPMELALTRHMPAVLEIETAANMFYDEDFGVMAISKYSFSEEDFYKLGPDGYAIWGYTSSNGQLLGYIAFRYDIETKTVRIIKLELLRDGNESAYCKYILSWIIRKSKNAQLVFLTNEADDLKNYCLKELGFKSELRKQAFRKMGRDGIWWTLTRQNEYVTIDITR